MTTKILYHLYMGDIGIYIIHMQFNSKWSIILKTQQIMLPRIYLRKHIKLISWYYMRPHGNAYGIGSYAPNKVMRIILYHSHWPFRYYLELSDWLFTCWSIADTLCEVLFHWFLHRHCCGFVKIIKQTYNIIYMHTMQTVL